MGPPGAPWQRLYFLPDPHGHSWLRPTSENSSSEPAADDAATSTSPCSDGAEYDRFCGCFGRSRPLARTFGVSRPAWPGFSKTEAGVSSTSLVVLAGRDDARPGVGDLGAHRLELLLRVVALLVVLLDLDVEVEQEADRLRLDAVHDGGEHVEALALVLHERVALGVRAQVDALAQVVHLVEVLAPLAVEHGEDDAPLELAHDLLADLVLATGVGLVRVDLEGLDQLVAVDVRQAAGLLLEHVQVERRRARAA